MKKWTTVGSAIVTALALTFAGVATGVATASGPSAVAVPPPAKPPMTAFDLHTNSASESHFVPITPCRMADTRAAGGKIGSTVRTFMARGAVGYPAQGGPQGGCGIPSATVAITAAVTTVGGSNDGYLNLWPSDKKEPGTSLVHYSAVKAMATTTTVNLASYDGQADFSVHNHNASAHVIIDVLGYYIVPIVATIRPTGSIYSGTNAVLYSSRTSVGNYTVTVGRFVDYCSPSVTVYETGHYAKVTTYAGTEVKVAVWKLVDGAAVPVDDYVQLTVTC